MHCKGNISREEGFLRGILFQRKWGLESFWGKCLKQFIISDKVTFQNISSRIAAFRNEIGQGKICIGESLYTG